MAQSRKRNWSRWPSLLAMTLALSTLAPGVGSVAAQEATVALAIHCSGCSEREKAARASNAGDDLTVYVFDHEAKQVSKFWIEATVVEESPYTVNKRVLSREPEPDLAAAFAELVESWNTMLESLPLQVPASSGFQSVAGALHDPMTLQQRLRDWMERDPEFFPPGPKVDAFESAWKNNGLAWAFFEPVVLRFTPVMGKRSVPIQFGDGSRAGFDLSLVFNPLSERHSWVADKLRDFELADGRPAPTGPFGWRGFETTQTGAALDEWLRYARYSDDVDLRGWNDELPDQGTLRCGEDLPVICKLESR